MMYFLVSTPPKMFGVVSPAFSAMSTKVAIGEAAAGFACCPNSDEWPGTKWLKSTIHRKKKTRIRMSPLDGRSAIEHRSSIGRSMPHGGFGNTNVRVTTTVVKKKAVGS